MLTIAHAKKNILEQESDKEKINKLTFLCSQGLRLTQTDQEGYCVLHWSMQNSGGALFSWLMRETPTLMENPLKDPFEQSAEKISEYPQNIRNRYILFATAVDNENLQMVQFLMGDTISNGQLDLVKLYHAKDPESVNRANKWGNYPMHLAAQEGHLNIISYLLANESCFFTTKNKVGFIPFELAITNVRLNCLPFMIENGAHLASTQFMSIAIKSTQIATLKALFDLEEEIKETYRKADREALPLVELSDENGNKPIHQVAELIVSAPSLDIADAKLITDSYAIEVIKLLLEHGATYNQQNNKGQSFIQLLFSRYELLNHKIFWLINYSNFSSSLVSFGYGYYIRNKDGLFYRYVKTTGVSYTSVYDESNSFHEVKLKMTSEDLKTFDKKIRIQGRTEKGHCYFSDKKLIKLESRFSSLKINFLLDFYRWLFAFGQFSEANFQEAFDVLIIVNKNSHYYRKKFNGFIIRLFRIYMELLDKEEKKRCHTTIYSKLYQLVSGNDNSPNNQLLFLKYLNVTRSFSDENFYLIFTLLAKNNFSGRDLKLFIRLIFNAWNQVSEKKFILAFKYSLRSFYEGPWENILEDFVACMTGDFNFERVNFFVYWLLKILLNELQIKLNAAMQEEDGDEQEECIELSINILNLLDAFFEAVYSTYDIYLAKQKIKNDLAALCALTQKMTSDLGQLNKLNEHPSFLELLITFILYWFPEHYAQLLSSLQNQNLSFCNHLYEHGATGVFVGAKITNRNFNEEFFHKLTTLYTKEFLAFGLHFDTQGENTQLEVYEQFKEFLKNNVTFVTTAKEFSQLNLSEENRSRFIHVLGALLLDPSRFKQEVIAEIFLAFIGLVTSSVKQFSSNEYINYAILKILRLLLDHENLDFSMITPSWRKQFEELYLVAYRNIHNQVPSLLELCANVVIIHRNQRDRLLIPSQNEKLVRIIHDRASDTLPVKTHKSLFLNILGVFKQNSNNNENSPAEITQDNVATKFVPSS